MSEMEFMKLLMVITLASIAMALPIAGFSFFKDRKMFKKLGQ